MDFVLIGISHDNTQTFRKGASKAPDMFRDVFSKLEVDEEAQARKLLEKNKYKWERLTGFEKRKKVSAYFARRGFSWDVIRKVTE